jgi:hypothetical protein
MQRGADGQSRGTAAKPSVTRGLDWAAEGGCPPSNPA